MKGALKMLHTKFAIWLGLIILTAGLFIGCKKKPQSSLPESNNTVQQPAPKLNPDISQKPQTSTSPKPTLETIVSYARTWQPTYVNWYGKMAPDFAVTDITGKSHKLSSYKGKNVIVNFWATWCGPCRMEIPSFIKLRSEIGDDKLVILGISYIDFRSSAETIKQFVSENSIINYTIIAAQAESMPSPYNYISAIPTTFFINPDGTIKIVAEGVTPFSQIKAILEAEQ
jgi:thiol-disulfide isomerase/thioredoxin